MDIYCTRPNCPRPINSFSSLDDSSVLKNVTQKYCATCGMPLILDGRYIPSKGLKRGGLGTAFLAYDRRTPGMRQCVVKQLQPSGNISLEQMEKVTQLFHREADVLEQLGTHPHIPELFAFFALETPSWQYGEGQELFYLVQQYIDGEDLEQEYSRIGKFSEAEILNILQQILPVLKFVHERGSIHRDIKPSNIMRDRYGKLYLVDFGAVKQVVGASTIVSGSDLTNSMPSGLLTGIFTPGFAPPEQANCLAVYPSSDLYALAATCVFLLTGQQWTRLTNPHAKTVNSRTLQVKISDRLGYILGRMLKEEPAVRFQSASEVIDALQSDLPPFLKGASHHLEWFIEPFLIGFVVGLVAIALTNLLPLAISIGLVGMSLGGLIYAQYRQILNKNNLLIITGSTLIIVLLLISGLSLPSLQFAILGLYNLPNNPFLVAFVATLTGIFGVVLFGLSQLIYQLLIRIH